MNMITKIAPYSLNIVYLSLVLFSLISTLINYITSKFFNYSIQIHVNEPFTNLHLYVIGVIWFIIAILISYKTTSNNLRFVCLYFSGQIYFIIAIFFSLLIFTPLYSLILIGIITPFVFLGEKKRQSDTNKNSEYEIKFSPYTLNVGYLCIVSFMALSSVIDFFSDNYSYGSLVYDKWLPSSIFGLVLFISAIIIAYITKSNKLKFVSLYLSGQIYLVIVLTYVEVMNRAIIPILKN